MNKRNIYLFQLILMFILPTVLSQNYENPNELKATTAVKTEMQDAFQYSNIVRTTIEKYIREALPPEARGEGNGILQAVNEGLATCDALDKTALNMEQYNFCCSSLMGDGMAALGALQAKYRPRTSGASRMSLFWW